jgi:hypothetical protein
LAMLVFFGHLHRPHGKIGFITNTAIGVCGRQYLPGFMRSDGRSPASFYRNLLTPICIFYCKPIGDNVSVIKRHRANCHIKWLMHIHFWNDERRTRRETPKHGALPRSHPRFSASLEGLPLARAKLHLRESVARIRPFSWPAVADRRSSRLGQYADEFP